MKNLLRNHRWRTSLTTAFCAAAMGVASTAWAATEIQVWHALNEYNADVFADLVKKYNRSQSDVKVVLQDFYDVSALEDRKSTRLNSSHVAISYAVFCLKKKN